MSSDNYDRVLEEYYTLKRDYDGKLAAQKNRIMRNPSLSTEAKQQKLARLRAKCIHCGKPGGTAFSNVGGTLTAVCGSTTTPCTLDIRIVRKQSMPSNEVSDLFQASVDQLRSKVIAAKLDLLFQFIDEPSAIAAFEELKTQLESDSKTLVKSTDAFYDVVADPVRAREVKSKSLERYLLIKELRDLVHEYEEDGDSGKMTAVTNLYTERLLPVCSSLRSFKYRSVSVERDDEDVYHLREEVYTPASVEYPLNAGAGKVISNKQKRGKH